MLANALRFAEKRRPFRTHCSSIFTAFIFMAFSITLWQLSNVRNEPFENCPDSSSLRQRQGIVNFLPLLVMVRADIFSCFLFSHTYCGIRLILARVHLCNEQELGVLAAKQP